MWIHQLGMTYWLFILERSRLGLPIRAIKERVRWSKYRKAGVVFVHVPKAAGSSISRALYGRGMGHVPAKVLAETSDYQSLESFAVIREPFSRLESAYHYAVSGGTTQGALMYNPDYEGELFSSFERFVLEWLPHQKEEALDPIFKRQRDYLAGADGELLVKRLFLLEEMAMVVEYLHGFGVTSVPKVNVQSRKGRVSWTSAMRDAAGAFYQEDLALYESVRHHEEKRGEL